MEHPAFQSTQSTSSAPAASNTPEQPNKPRARNWKKWILAGIALLLVIIGGGTYVLSQQKTQEPEAVSKTKPTVSSPSPTPDPTADWKTYTNEAQQYSFRYPANLTIDESKDLTANVLQQVEIKAPTTDNQQTYSFSLRVEKDRTYTQIVSRLGGADATLSSTVERKQIITVGGLPATKVLFNNFQADGQGVVKETGKSIFVVIDRNKPITISLYNVDEEELLDQILQTFKFTDSLEAESPTLQLAKEDLAKRLNIQISAITTVSQTYNKNQWSDGSMGCPRPGAMYTQSFVDGYRIVLSYNGKIYYYHGKTNNPPFLCENPSN